MSIIEPYNNELSVTDIRCSPTPYAASNYYFIHQGNYNYDVGEYLSRKKKISYKERLISERAAFKLFYKKPQFTVIKNEKDFSAEFTETIKRESKFKNINLNLIV